MSAFGMPMPVSLTSTFISPLLAEANAEPSALGYILWRYPKGFTMTCSRLSCRPRHREPLPEVHLKGYALSQPVFRTLGGGADEFDNVHALQKRRLVGSSRERGQRSSIKDSSSSRARSIIFKNSRSAFFVVHTAAKERFGIALYARGGVRSSCDTFATKSFTASTLSLVGYVLKKYHHSGVFFSFKSGTARILKNLSFSFISASRRGALAGAFFPEIRKRP